MADESLSRAAMASPSGERRRRTKSEKCQIRKPDLTRPAHLKSPKAEIA
jgi:hypothetical protein